MRNKLFATAVALITAVGTITLAIVFVLVWRSYTIADYARSNAYQIMAVAYNNETPKPIIAELNGERWEVAMQDLIDMGKVLTPYQPSILLLTPQIESAKGIKLTLPTGAKYYVAPYPAAVSGDGQARTVIWRQNNTEIICLLTSGYDTYNRLAKSIRNGKMIKPVPVTR